MSQGQVEEQALLLPIFRHQDHARLPGRARRMESHRLIADNHGPGVRTLETDKCLEQFGASGADQAEETDNFARRHGK